MRTILSLALLVAAGESSGGLARGVDGADLGRADRQQPDEADRDRHQGGEHHHQLGGGGAPAPAPGAASTH